MQPKATVRKTIIFLNFHIEQFFNSVIDLDDSSIESRENIELKITTVLKDDVTTDDTFEELAEKYKCVLIILQKDLTLIPYESYRMNGPFQSRP